ncbi:MAG: phosphatidate cytidylyltransferase, partial [Oscillospiraceae bacterium]|nr:phosphatidate cytidylyltransferase [Oscillospiraceae bacterium]
MLKRILTGVIGGVYALVVIIVLPPYALNIALALFAVIAVYEFLATAGVAGHWGLVITGMAAAAMSPFFLMVPPMYDMLAVGAFVMTLVVIQLIYHEKLSVERTGFVFFLVFLILLAFDFLAFMRYLDGGAAGWIYDGVFYVFLTIVMAWLCDIGAYFIGTFFGKTKLCPGISPKKTVEGLLGGIVISLLMSLLAALLYQWFLDANAASIGVHAHVVYWQVAIL